MNPIKVLIADDEADFLASLTKVLSRRGVTVKTVGDGGAAVRAAAEAEFDVIVLDLRMPVQDGISALREIRARDTLTPVLILSGHADLGIAAEALKIGASDYLLKPCSVEALMAALETASEKKAIVADLAAKQPAGKP